MASVLGFTLIYLASLVLPGLFLCRWFKKKPSPLLVIALSYSLFCMAVSASNLFQLPANNFVFGYLAGVVIGGAVSLRKTTFSLPFFKPVFVIGGLSFIYQLLFSAYSEVPADMYTHLERIQRAIGLLQDNKLGPPLDLQQIFKQGLGVYYFFVAMCLKPLTLELSEVFWVIDYLNRTLFLIGVFFFSKKVFKASRNAIGVSYLVVIFTFLHFGINVFSFVRYYTLAPSILAFLLYFAATSAFLDTLLTPTNPVKQRLASLSLVAFFMLSAATVHVQEAMFIGVIIPLICLTYLTTSRFADSHFNNADRRFAISIVSAALLSFVILYFYSKYNFLRAPNAHWRLWDFGDIGWGLPRLTVLNLNYQFIRVMTLWGALVYFLFFINIKRYRNNYFLLAGMFSPLVTILNPFFIDLFLRHYNSTTVWRLCYLIPIHFVAADLAFHYAKRFQFSQDVSRKVIPAVVLISLIGLLLPIANSYKRMHYSRFPTLFSNQQTLGHTGHAGLIDYLNSLDIEKQVLTDPMTGYLISGMTSHHSERKKFFRNRRFKNFTFESYDDSPLKKYQGHLLIVNLRRMDASNVGRLANHWNEFEWAAKHHYYPEQLLSHLESNPKRFKEAWRGDDIIVYEIH